MKNKGFTLVELLSIITILVIIVGITFPSIIVIKSRNEDKFLKEYKNIIINAADSYMNDGSLKNPSSPCYNLSINTLIKEQYLKSLENEITTNYVIVTKGVGVYEYELSNTKNSSCTTPLKKDTSMVEDKELILDSY